ncbi:MFS transporter [Cellulomonas fimi]|uniref:Major facilitator superfamily MFS_1 n=1 Tax=Cellulomonas fimi (strain ATCC 484 / DSM 20113 / JCM 1341 / CCUG 24087 / LMG 16345 / NBRC 15513 / NCIMB 8980 / NCTC 7547 / NRS-133) TaxID=590998 RepID=F4H606_CELFA|nr:MFS transporter [Cellulomonas fimi]AEE46736.1 major facilitator superfamily MFS_1 [Cellulomonas fimi ATCC 484]NNH07619.1 MFS transporter [Cellulomonas fimi]VEH34030.1 enterobactin exporter EntS [Cellulomonas fimi]
MPTLLSTSVLTPLRTPALRRLWAGQLAALLAAEIHLVVLAWLALDLTGSGLALGTVLVVGMLPRAALTLVGGVTADRHDHRRVLAAAHATRAAVVAALAVTAAAGGLRLWHLVAAGLALGAVTAFAAPAVHTVVPRECPPEQLRAGNALLRGTAEVVGTAGPVLGGGLVALAGTGPTLAAVASCYTLAFVVTASLLVRAPAGSPWRGTSAAAQPAPPHGTRGSLRRTLADLREGAAALRHDPFALRVLALVAAAGLALSGPVTVGVPWLARRELDLDAAAFGLLLSLWTAGSLLGVVIAGSVRRVPRWRVAMTTVAGVLVAALVTLATTPTLPVAAACLLAMGTAAGALNVLLVTWLQQRAPAEALGRIMSWAELAEVVVAPVSYLAAGVLLDASLTALFVGAAAVLLLGTLAVVTPGLRPTGAAVRPRPTATGASGSPPR